MPKYTIKLTEQEELSLAQMMLTPGSDVLLKLLQNESLDAQSEAMECKSHVDAERSLALLKAQVAVEMVSSLTKKLCGYRVLNQPQAEELDPAILDILQTNWERN